MRPCGRGWLIPPLHVKHVASIDVPHIAKALSNAREVSIESMRADDVQLDGGVLQQPAFRGAMAAVGCVLASKDGIHHLPQIVHLRYEEGLRPPQFVLFVVPDERL